LFEVLLFPLKLYSIIFLIQPRISFKISHLQILNFFIFNSWQPIQAFLWIIFIIKFDFLLFNLFLFILINIERTLLLLFSLQAHFNITFIKFERDNKLLRQILAPKIWFRKWIIWKHIKKSFGRLIQKFVLIIWYLILAPGLIQIWLLRNHCIGIELRFHLDLIFVFLDLILIAWYIFFQNDILIFSIYLANVLLK